MLFGVAALGLYAVLPGLTEVLQAWPRLAEIAPGWFALMFLAELASFGCVWWLQRFVFVGARWFPLITSQLASNAFSRVVPGGAAAGGALQYRMLTAAGVDTTRSAAGLTTISLLTTASVLLLPLLSLPAVLDPGVTVPEGLAAAAWIGAGVFAAMFAIALVLAATDRPLRSLGRWVDRLRRRFGRRVERDLGAKLIDERDIILRSLGRRWPWAVMTAVGKWLFDFYALLAALAATGDETTTSLVLLAYVAGAVLSMIPITPGGVGFVEAGLTATLVAAGVTPGRAVLATLAYRLVSYWVPMVAGLGAWVSFRATHPDGGATTEVSGRGSPESSG